MNGLRATFPPACMRLSYSTSLSTNATQPAAPLNRLPRKTLRPRRPRSNDHIAQMRSAYTGRESIMRSPISAGDPCNAHQRRPEARYIIRLLHEVAWPDQVQAAGPKATALTRTILARTTGITILILRCHWCVLLGRWHRGSVFGNAASTSRNPRVGCEPGDMSARGIGEGARDQNREAEILG